MNSSRRLLLAALAVISGAVSPTAIAAAPASKCAWYENDPLARELSQLTPVEIGKFVHSDLVDVQPVILPHPENVVGLNDYFDWPVATMVEDTMLLLYDRRHFHFGGVGPNTDADSGIRMLMRSNDGGKTWTKPVDLLQNPAWANSPFKGWGGGFGVHDGVVYLALDQGVYQSKDKGATWHLVADRPVFKGIPGPLWSAAMRITFTPEHGMTLWTTRGFQAKRRANGDYGRYLGAVSTLDGGRTWTYAEQALPDNIRLSEITPLQFPGGLAFFLRNGIHDNPYAQAFSATGWFPFTFAVANMKSEGTIDTPDVNYNPVTKRLEAAVTFRNGESDGPQGRNKLNLYSISPADLAAGKSVWQFDGTLIRYKGKFSDKSDGMNPVGSVIDPVTGKQYIHVWAGNQVEQGGIFQYTRSLDTPAVSAYLKSFYEQDSAKTH